MNVKNPYSEIINLMRDQGSQYNPSSIELGIVSSTDPIVVQLGDLPLDKDNLYIADYLKQGYSRQISIPSTDASGSTSNGSISSIGLPKANLNFSDSGLKEGDIVALIKVSTTRYLILLKVVAA
ncbi:DUF2577 domain-containing protein [Clostridium sp. AWRP]|uniref:DUF2577 domain-containing protein n=1 Tax=Clostridium sp. AWRP TaxID=2212991 RepID=UPI000FD74EBD|nr:DUF2577 domain-containing protein [Clostridium sp. AWRP]AZV57921.1 DUF2577 domain-containing protein [Clostridium sp. AWRP]